MRVRLTIWGLFGLLVTLGLCANAAACIYPYHPYGVPGWPAYVSRAYVPESLYGREYIPYFALYPPVYYTYSARCPSCYRRYTCPCVYRPTTVTPKIEPIEPLRIRNPYVAEQPDGLPSAVRESPPPLRIINPHVVQVGDPRVSPDAVMPRQPQVVYPAARAEQRP